MPQLRWTLLILGVLFVILLAWIERRRQHRGFLDQGPAEHDPMGGSPGGADNPSQPMFREPTLNLPEMRARDPIGSHELPVVEIEDDSLTARRVEPQLAAALNPPTLSLPVMESGPVKRERPADGRPVDPPVDPPAMSASEWIKPGPEAPTVPRLDTPAVKRTAPNVEPKSDTRPPLESHDDGEAERAFNEAVFGDPVPEPGNDTDYHLPTEAPATDFRVAEPAQDPEFSAGDGLTDEGGATLAQEDRELPATASAPLFTAADVTPIKEPIVDWPPDDSRKVVALRLVALPPERLAGRALRLALASEGFVLGKFQIFHKPDSSGRAVLSAANLSKPGTFDIETMDSQRFGGLSLFAVLPGPKPPLKAFEDLLATARNLNERLQGALQDERGGPLTPTRIAALRESVGTEDSP
jgi:FtsZ-interacting cell division protein ZipA